MYRDMMDGTVTQSYAYKDDDADANELSRRSSKKRRLGNRVADQEATPLDSWAAAQQQQPHAPNIHGFPVEIPKFTPQDMPFVSNEAMPGSTALSIPQSASWNQGHAYPVQDVGSYTASTAYNQPFYPEQAGNTSYASSWPPVSHAQPAYQLSDSMYPQTGLDPLQYGFPQATELGSGVLQDQPSSLPVRAGMNDYNQISSHNLEHTQIMLQSLPNLQSLATHVIHVIVKNTHAQLHSYLYDEQSEVGRAFRNLKFNFEQTRKLFEHGSTDRELPFISSSQFEPSHQDTLRKTNIATFILAVLDTSSVQLAQLHEQFIPTFVPYQQKLLKWQGTLLLELKTQAYIAALRQGQVDRSLDDFFPTFAERPLLMRHPETPSLFPSERDFVDRCQARRQYLASERQTASVADLSVRYPWTDFVRDFIGLVGSNINGLLSLTARGHRSQLSADLRRRQAGMSHSPQRIAADPNTSMGSDLGDGLSRSGSYGAGSADARKGSGGTTIRQPWTKPEEEALLAGLERVNGPHWSQILALYGRGGSINEVLKDRNQVQLKDKARNLKLWHLKLGKEVPDNLKGVTGELRKRGGARARAALEAEEKNAARLERGISDGTAREGLDPRLNAAEAIMSQTSRI